MQDDKTKQAHSQDENDAITFIRDTQTAMKRFRGVSVTALVCAAVVAIAAFYFAFSHVWSLKDQVYVVDQQAVLQAKKVDNEAQKDLEIIHHVTRFHEKLYNLSPNMETIKANIEEAFNLSDESVRMYDNARREQQFYTKLIDNGMVEEIHIDSVKVNTNVYPFTARAFGNLYVVRPSNVTKYRFISSCSLSNTGRSITNPNGLIIEKYREELVEKEGTVVRR